MEAPLVLFILFHVLLGVDLQLFAEEQPEQPPQHFPLFLSFQILAMARITARRIKPPMI